MKNENFHQKKKNSTLKIGLILVLLACALNIHLPYYVEGPGKAIELSQMIKVDGDEDKQDGSFMLTSVSRMQATPLTFLTSFMPFHELVKKSDYLPKDQTEQQYDLEQEFNMRNSINTATKVAFEAADEAYQVKFNGVYVSSVVEESSFKGKLDSGDTIESVDGEKFQDVDSFIGYIQSKKVGETVEITYIRDKKQSKVSGELIDLNNTGKAGIGITLVDDSTVETEIPVEIDTNRIGGPSAGFMFSLEIYSQLQENDIRKGYEIAGTGTISYDGTVGRIGGIDKKVAAADKAGAEIFFAPDDEITDAMKEANPGIKSNYQEALAAAESLKTDMKIVPIKTFQDGLDYLASLKER